MKVRIDTWCLPKHGSSAAEYEDAFAPPARQGLEQCHSHLNVAVADGATESSFAREWASDLAKAYRTKARRFYDEVSLARLVGGLCAWRSAEIERVLSERDAPWYLEQKARAGAFAAVVGLSLWDAPAEAADRTPWRAFAVGDCCVFQLRGHELVARFPLQTSADFSNRPFLLSSRADRNGLLADHAESGGGHWKPGDEFLLMSDALACWFLRRWELRSDPFTELLARIGSEAEFAEWIARERNEHVDGLPLMRNDDVTLTRCQMLGG